MHPEALGRVSGAVDTPPALAEDFLDVRALDRRQRRGIRNRRGLDFLEIVGHEHQRVARRMDQRALDDVLELPDVARPRMRAARKRP
jgi:hypothetical protein